MTRPDRGLKDMAMARAIGPCNYALSPHPSGVMRIQLRRSKGWRMPENTIKVDRSNRFFGNPFRVGMIVGGVTIESATEAVEFFRLWLEHNPLGQTVARMARDAMGPGGIRGKNLACWCGINDPCHANVLIEIANGVPAL